MRAVRGFLLGFAMPFGFVLAIACSPSGVVGDGAGGGTGSGGAAATGGATATGGTTATGGATATGGRAATGGVTATGGRPGTGGVTATGGRTGTGGATATGGATSGGGAGGAATSGCGMTASPKGVITGQITVGGQARTYVLSVPAAYDPAVAYPLGFLWHGLGGNGSQARQYFRIEQSSGGQGIFVYPDGLPTQNDQTGWTLTATGIDVQLFDALLADVSSKYCINSNRVFSAGHSFGAMMTNRLGCFRGNVLRGIAPVAGMPPTGTCTGQVAAWIAHGMADTTVEYTQGEATRDYWTRANACTTATTATTPAPCVAFGGCAGDAQVQWCAHTGMHEWPSFAGAGVWGFFAGLQ